MHPRDLKDGEFTTRDFTLEMRIDDLNNREMSGHASIFGNVDSFGTRFMPGAFKKTLKRNKGQIRFLRDHDWSRVLGPMVELEEDAKGLAFRARFSDTSLADETRTLVADKALTDLSIGFQTKKSKFDEDAEVRDIIEVDLWEVSVVTFGANDKTKIEAVRATEQSALYGTQPLDLVGELREVDGEQYAVSGPFSILIRQGNSHMEDREEGDDKDDNEESNYVQSLRASLAVSETEMAAISQER